MVKKAERLGKTSSGRAGASAVEVRILASEKESQRLIDTCAEYARGWQAGFDMRTMGLAVTDWEAFRMLMDEGYDEPLYRGVRHGFQASWCVEHRNTKRPAPRNTARVNGRGVRVRNGCEVLAFGALFGIDPALPAGFRVSGMRVELDGDTWRGWVTGKTREAVRKNRARDAHQNFRRVCTRTADRLAKAQRPISVKQG